MVVWLYRCDVGWCGRLSGCAVARCERRTECFLILLDGWHRVTAIPCCLISVCVVFSELNLATVFNHLFARQCLPPSPCLVTSQKVNKNSNNENVNYQSQATTPSPQKTMEQKLINSGCVVSTSELHELLSPVLP